jgi:hypothetical protein
VRVLILLILIPIVWLLVAEQYNDLVVAVSGVLVPGDLELRALSNYIQIDHAQWVRPVSIDGFTLHYGMILLTVLVLAAVGIDTMARIGWLAGFIAGVFLLHVVGVALLAHGIVWTTTSTDPEASGETVFSLFAIFWGLLPALIGGAWAIMYWIPKASQPDHATETDT